MPKIEFECECALVWNKETRQYRMTIYTKNNAQIKELDSKGLLKPNQKYKVKAVLIEDSKY